jgi:hypothetical protein
MPVVEGMRTLNDPGGRLGEKQAERFIQLAINESVMLKQVKVKRLYPWWQVPIRKPISRLRVWVAIREARYMDKPDSWWLGIAGRVAARLTRFEDRLLGSPYRVPQQRFPVWKDKTRRKR